ncbi:COR domain-containing protein [Nostoc sp. PA-18-2419]|uniref:COR domain-containing protein n=1 Tax=Nostoc sp. PA-18-2419 TaxID=2575443 RepID=UPI001108E714|nr:COR domain-containing protein [Nostoc sp. PA-18-2419]
MHDELLRLMINFKLCYEIPRSLGKYIAPQLLSANQPSYDWNETNNLILRYTYEFMPKGIITQFIVVMHELINEQKCVWKSGVILSKDQTKAEVIEYYDKREIKIRVAGHHKRDLMTIVTHELDKIHDSYNKRLKYNKLIPCNCHTCKDSQEPHFYSFEILRKFVADKQESIQCQKSYQMVDALGLIDVMNRREFLKIEQQKEGDFLSNYSEVKNHNVVVTINNVIQPSKQENNFMTESSKQQ